MAPNKRQSVNSLIINRVNSRDNIRNMIDAGLQSSSEFLWKIFMKCNYTSRESNKLTKDDETGMYIAKHPEEDLDKNCVQRAKLAWLREQEIENSK